MNIHKLLTIVRYPIAYIAPACFAAFFTACGSVGGVASLLDEPTAGNEEAMAMLPVLGDGFNLGTGSSGSDDSANSSGGPEIGVIIGGSPHQDGGIIDLGNQVVSTTGAPLTVILENTGTENLHLLGGPLPIPVGSDAVDFGFIEFTATVLKPGEVASASLYFRPNSLGFKVAAITIPTNDADEADYVINLIGTSTVTPEAEISLLTEGDTKLNGDTADFGTILVNQETTLTFTIRNTGNAPLHLGGSPTVVLSGTDAADFVVNQPPATIIAPSGNTTFTVTFRPTSLINLGAKTATLTIASDDSDESTFVLGLRGFAVLSL